MSGLITGLSQYNTDASPHRDWRDGLNDWDWLGTSTKSAVKGRELVDGKIKANPLDKLFGNSDEELTNQYYKDRAKKIEAGIGGDLLAEGRDIKVTDSDKVIRKKSKDLAETNLAISELRSTGGYEGSLTELKDRPASEIYALVGPARRKGIELDDESNPATKRAIAATAETNRRYGENVSWQKSRAEIEDNRIALERERMWKDKQEGRRETALTRQMNAENNAMQMQLEYSRLSQADANRSQDRKDKVIMALLGGLGNLGAGFTI